MKRLLTLILFGVLAMAAQAPPADKGAGASAPAKTPEKPEGASAPEAKPVPLDDELRSLIDDRNVIIALLEFTEQARGEGVTLRYSVADLRARFDAKGRRIAAWYAKRGVPADPKERAAKGWTFDAKAEAFVPPVKVEESKGPKVEKP